MLDDEFGKVLPLIPSHTTRQIQTRFGFTVKLVVHGLVNPLRDARQPLVEAHYHHPLIHGLSAA